MEVVCVLRVGGTTLDFEAVKRALNLEPYRVDVCGKKGATTNCLHFDVVDIGSPKELVSKIEGFLSDHAAQLASLARLEEVEFRNLDVGVMLYDTTAYVSIELGETLIRRLAECHLSLSVSTYPASSPA